MRARATDVPSEEGVRPARVVGEAVGLWVAVGAVVLLCYELVDRTWVDALPEQGTAVRLLRAAAVSLTATVLTAVNVLRRRSVPSLRASLAGMPAVAAPGQTAAQLATWFVGLRWVAVLVLAAGISAASMAGPPDTASWPLWVGLAVPFALNTWLTLAGRSRTGSPGVLTAQIVADVAVIGWLVHHAGGISNPFAPLVAFHAVIAAIVLAPARARVVVVGIAAAVAALAALEASGALPPRCVLEVSHACGEPEGMRPVAAGLGIAALCAGCGLFVLVLVSALRLERDDLTRVRVDLAEEREKLSSIIECMGDVVIFADRRGRIRLMNRAAEQLWPEGAPTDGTLRVCHTEAAWERLLEKVADPLPLEDHPVLELDGRAWEANYAAVRLPDGRLRGVVMVARDITERRRQQQWRAREERLAVVGKLAATVAHEINNPLGTIGLLSQHALRGVEDGTPMHRHLTTILRNVRGCSATVQGLLDYARKRPPERKPVAIAQLLSDVGRTVEPQAARAGVAVDVQLADGLPERVVADARQVHQAIVNLGLNAVEAMVDGGTLTLRAEPVEGVAAVRLVVRDTGPGLCDEAARHLFSPFFTTKSEGTGLGLAVARDIVDAHGGELTVVSEPGQGCTFAAVLPTGGASREEEAA